MIAPDAEFFFYVTLVAILIPMPGIVVGFLGLRLRYVKWWASLGLGLVVGVASYLLAIIGVQEVVNFGPDVFWLLL